MKILAIETSCDETGVSLIKAEGDLDNPQFKILEELVASQIETHRPWGGVVPHLAKREHNKNLPVLIDKIKNKEDIDYLAVTVGPGLDPCLWSGVNFVKDFHQEMFPDKQLIGVNHLEGHLYSFLLDKNIRNNVSSMFPSMQLVVSGGHTILVYMKNIKEWEILGQTRDDAAGEAFDKVARMLDLQYPGGPEIEKLSKEGDPEKYDFPRPMINSGDYDFSFSGLKTALLYHIQENPNSNKADTAASFQQAVVDTLVTKTIKAAREYDVKSVMLSGGVAANTFLRDSLKNKSEELELGFYIPPIKYNTDNGTVIGIAAYISILTDKNYEIEAQSNLSL